MIRIIHKETGKALVISNSHADAMTVGKHALYRVDPKWDEEAHKTAKVAAEEAKAEAEQLKSRQEMAEAEAEEKEVSTAKEEKASTAKRGSSKTASK